MANIKNANTETQVRHAEKAGSTEILNVTIQTLDAAKSHDQQVITTQLT
ncbi:hypothetical protein LHV14_02905, partial [Limosilactobacillus reuteri]|nr:hypothetical protein [Limosilactobacillus reuteri]